MAKVSEPRITKKFTSRTGSFTTLRAGISISNRTELGKQACCPQEDEETRKILEYSCGKIATRCEQWQRNFKQVH